MFGVLVGQEREGFLILLYFTLIFIDLDNFLGVENSFYCFALNKIFFFEWKWHFVKKETIYKQFRILKYHKANLVTFFSAFRQCWGF